MRFLVTPFQELQKPVKFINNFYIDNTMPMKKLRVPVNAEFLFSDLKFRLLLV